MKVQISRLSSKFYRFTSTRKSHIAFILILFIPAFAFLVVKSRTVNAAGSPAACYISVSPNRIQSGESTTVGWIFSNTTSRGSSSGAVQAAINSQGVSGSVSVTLNTIGRWSVSLNATGTDGKYYGGCANAYVDVVAVDVPPENRCEINAYKQNGAWLLSWTTHTTNWSWRGQLYTGSPSSMTGDIPYPGVDNLELNGTRTIDPPSGAYTTYTYLAYNPANRSQFIACNGGADRRNETPPTNPTDPPGVPGTPGTVNRCNVGWTKSGNVFTLVWRSNVSSQYSGYKALIYRSPQTNAGTTYGLGLNDSHVIVPPTGNSTYVVIIYNPLNNAPLTSCSVMVVNDASGPSDKRFVDNPPGGKVGNRDCDRGTSNKFLHARQYWLTAYNDSRGPVTIPAGTDALGLKVNAIGEVCEGFNYVNVLPNGGVSNQTINNDTIYIKEASVSASPSIPGISISPIVGRSLAIDRSGQYAAAPGLTFTGITNFPFSVSGLNNINAGVNYTITIDTNVAMTALANGQRVCASPALKPTSTIEGLECNLTPQQFIIQINQGGNPPCTPGEPECPNPNPGFQCQIQEPILKQPGEVASTTIYRGKTSARLRWTTSGDTVGYRAYADDGTELTNAIGVGVTVSPVQTKTYYIARSPTANVAQRYCAITVYVVIPANRPYIKIEGSDLFSGASFGPTCKPTNEAINANIDTNGYFENKETWGYSGSQYGAFASGTIGGSGLSNNVFLGNNGFIRANLLDLLFANDQSGDGNGLAGNYYDSLGAGMQCINLDSVKNDPAKITVPNQVVLTDIVANDTGTYEYNSNVVLGNISVNGQKTIVVKGNVTIAGDIVYTSPYQGSNIPFLRIIADNIYINPTVKTIDANLVAYPTMNGKENGLLDTCGDGTWRNDYVINSCLRSGTSTVISSGGGIVFNGSITARRILWKGTWGSVGITDSTVDQDCLYAKNASGCAAERVIFNPEAYLAGFERPTVDVFGNPVSTLELPPIY